MWDRYHAFLIGSAGVHAARLVLLGTGEGWPSMMHDVRRPMRSRRNNRDVLGGYLEGYG